MRRFSYLLAGLVLTLTLAIVSTVGAQVVPSGLPSNPRFQTVTITPTAATFSQLGLNVVGSTGSNYIVLSNNGVNKVILLNERVAGGNCSGDAVDDACLRSISGRLYGSDTSGSGQIPIGNDSATLTWSFQTANTVSCSAGGTDGTFVLHKIGKVVVVKVLTSGSCSMVSAAAQSTTNTPIPAAFRPATNSASASPALTGSANPLGQVSINTAGNLTITLPAASTTIGVPLGAQFSYSLD
jgi:hypothetical protein